jgi:phospholipase C
MKGSAMKRILMSGATAVATVSLLQPTFIAGTIAQSYEDRPLVTAQPFPGADVSPYFFEPGVFDRGAAPELITQLRQKVKYVFVIFNENHSFDNEFGTFPGVNGIYSDGSKPRSAADTPGFTQTFTDWNGNTNIVEPFLIGPAQNATFVDSVDHSHTGLATKLHVGTNGVPRMDQFAFDEYRFHASSAAASAGSKAAGINFSRLVMSHIDCDTIPLWWQYASRFTIFDNIFATEDTPSTPNAIAMIAGQSGETQWVKHPYNAAQNAEIAAIVLADGTIKAGATFPGYTGATGGNIPQQSGNTIEPLMGYTAPIKGTVTSKSYSGSLITQGPPLVNDPQPFGGSFFDTTLPPSREPTSPKENWAPDNTASNLTFATVPLTAMGRDIKSITSQDYNAVVDLADISQDIPHISKLNRDRVNWRWYQNGYDAEPTDAATGVPHENFVSHHEGPQYFGYLANSPAERANFRGENDFFTDIAGNNLPPDGGIIYVRGGYYNLNYPSVTPPIQNRNYPPNTSLNTPAGLTAADIAAINVAKSGDDDHPSYSDRQISEAMNARVVNAIASHPEIWYRSAIIITYDESDGYYDHVPPRILSYGPDGLPLSRGLRVPLLLISPYARVHAVAHAEGDHNAVIETINDIFNLPALSSLPDEAEALAAGNSPAFNQFGPPGFEQKHLGPRDTNSPITDSLLMGFDPERLSGRRPPLPPEYAMIPERVVNTFPHHGGNGCQAIGMTPEDQRQGIVNQIPAGFNTLPSTLPAYNPPRLPNN